METIGKIRRRRLVQGESISSIARELGVSRNTVKRALKVEGDAYEYRRTRQPMPKLGPFTALLDKNSFGCVIEGLLVRRVLLYECTERRVGEQRDGQLV